jgi:hypothetical protein
MKDIANANIAVDKNTKVAHHMLDLVVVISLCAEAID